MRGMKKPPLYVALIWHMHQPYYKKPLGSLYRFIDREPLEYLSSPIKKTIRSSPYATMYRGE